MENKKKVICPEDYIKLPFWFRSLNLGWEMTYPLGTRISLDKDSLIKAAKETTGLDDFGKDFRDEPLDRMLWSINHEANLHPLGRFITRVRIINLLANRLRAEALFKKHPEILEQELYPVWLIVGLQRTGTTKLQRLLNADPDNRTLLSWEALNPAPVPGEINNNIRIQKARTAEKALRVMAPGFFAIHPVEHLAPEEDILLLDISFMSTTPEATMAVPSYASWLEKSDQTCAYEYAARIMKLLQWQRPAKRWILKSPHHLEFLHLVEKVLGNVTFLWTHRDPCICIPSFLSMMSHSWAMFSNDVTPAMVAGHWVRKSTFILNKGVEYRNQNPKSRYIDIRYDDLVKDSMETLLRIYEENGGISEELMKKFQQSEEENPPRKYGIHEYSLSDFNLTEQDIQEKIEDYQDFKIHPR